MSHKAKLRLECSLGESVGSVQCQALTKETDLNGILRCDCSNSSHLPHSDRMLKWIKTLFFPPRNVFLRNRFPSVEGLAEGVNTSPVPSPACCPFTTTAPAHGFRETPKNRPGAYVCVRMHRLP